MWWVSLDEFYRQMLELKSRKVVYLDDYDPKNPENFVITFDGIYKNVVDYALPILKDFNYPFELFISSDYIGIDNSFDCSEPLADFVNLEELKFLTEMNGRLQWHTKSHPDLTKEKHLSKIVSELEIPDDLKNLDPQGFKWFAYPYGNFNQIVVDEVKKRFVGALSCNQGNDIDVYCLNRITVTNETTFKKASIAVIIASYNYGNFLIEAIESVLRQTRMPDEIIITDDASEDNTYEIAEFYQRKYPSLIRVNRNEKNLGIVKNFNKAVNLTNSDYITILGADNRYRSDFIEKTSSILDQYLDVGIAYSDFALFGSRAKVVYESFLPERRNLVKVDKFFIVAFPDFNEATKHELLTKGNFIHGSSMYRRNAFYEVGGYIEQVNLPEDYNLFSRIVRSGWNARRVPEAILEYRQHSKFQANIRLNTFAELQFYKDLSKSLYQEIDKLKWQLHILETEKLTIPNSDTLQEYQSLQSGSNLQNQVNFISIIVPWWDHGELLAIWESNLQYLANCEIIFIDNGSQLETELALQQFCQKYGIKLIRNQENRGFSAANNQGAVVATGDYILHLNNDVKILNFPAKYLCNLAANGIAGPGFMGNELGEIYLEGWALCIKKSSLQALGGWCEDYGPGYWDDVDLCYRAKIAGYSLTPIPEIHRLMQHKQNTTGRDGRLNQLALHIHNRGVFIKKHYCLYPKIVIDGVFFQINQTGIARVWKSLLEEWANNGFSKHIVLLDRAGSAPKFSMIRSRPVPAYDYSNADVDKDMLQQICDEEGADLFISTYYTTPTKTPSIFMAYDMIPEVMGWDTSIPMWQEKHKGIQHASSYIAISENTASDLSKFFADIPIEAITVAHCGVHNTFSPAKADTINAFKTKYGIAKPYFILVDPRNDYKNSILFFQAFSQLMNRDGFDIICTGSSGLLASEFKTYTSNSTIHMLQLSDEELAIAYSGAMALVYPSKYEGFGMPIVEAMACACPVITCPNASIPEVAGEAALYVNDDNVDELVNALCEIQKPTIRNLLITKGLQQAKNFSWSKMAKTVSYVLIRETLSSLNLKETNLLIFPDWSQPEEIINAELEAIIKVLATYPDSQKTTLLIDTSNSTTDDAVILVSGITMNLLLQEDVDISEGLEISLLEDLADIQWEVLLTRINSRIILDYENREEVINFQLKIHKNDDIKGRITEFKIEEFIENHELKNRLFQLMSQYKQEKNDFLIIDELRIIRNKLSKYLLDTQTNSLEKTYFGEAGESYKLLLNSGIQDEKLTDSEKTFFAEILLTFNQRFDDPKAIHYLLVLMLYCRPHKLPLAYDLTCIPTWFIDEYLKFMLKPPLYFQDRGEVDTYYRYMQSWVDYLHSNIVNKSESELWEKVAGYFTERANFIPLYFNNSNLKDIYTKRADIISIHLNNFGNIIDYKFPERSSERTKIRLGILASHFEPQTETFASLSVYKYLNRDIFEVILFTLHVSNHRLERYCVGHADTFIQLPAHLSKQIQTIREADLDILFISTNVTAVTNQITLLALHRLARIQIVDANSPVTTGMRHIDYYISSKLSEPENNPQQHYSETLVTLDSPPQCFDFATEEQIAKTITVNRESLGIDKNAIVYISGANYYKIIPELENSWAKIIASVPNAVLLLYPFNPNWSSSYPCVAFQKRIVSTFANYGLSQDRLIIFEPAPNRTDVKERLRIADVYLDSYPYSGMTSLIDPLEVGLPTVVMEAECSRSKKGSSLLRELQMSDLIANNEDAYIQLAVTLGTNAELRWQKSNQIKEKIQAKPRFIDSRFFSTQMGLVFQKLFQKYQILELQETLNLRDINFVVFPEWSYSEESIGLELERILKVLNAYPDSEKITLIIDTKSIGIEDAQIFVSSVAMNLLMNENVDITEGLEISFVEIMSDNQWKALLPNLTGRIVLENESKPALTQVPIQEIYTWELEKFISENLDVKPV